MNWFLLALISAVFSAAAAVSEKKTLFSMNALDFSFVVSAVTLLFSLPFFWMIQGESFFTVGIYLLLLKTAMSAAAFLFVMLSIKNLEISEALPLLALSPALIAVAGVIFINDSLNATEWTAVFMMAVGAYILELKKNSASLFEPLKTLFSFSKYSYVFYALFLFAITSLLDRVLLKDFKIPPYDFMAFQQLFYTVFFLGSVIIARRKLAAVSIKSINKSTFILILLIAFFTVIYRYTQIEATKIAPVALVISVKRLSVLMAIIMGGKLFSDTDLVRKIIATVIILAGAALLLN